MEEPQTARPRRPGRKPAVAGVKTDYEDVFGGPPRFSTPAKTARVHDYAEIFGGFASSCSIPFLELPVEYDDADAGVDPGGNGFDYAEIFGGFDGGEFGVSYEELVAEKTKRPDEANGRIPKKAGMHQAVAEVSKLSSEGPDGEFVATVETNEIFVDSHHSSDELKQFKMSYHKTNSGSTEEPTNGTTHVTQLNAVPGFTFVVNTLSSQTSKGDSVPAMEANGHSINADCSGIVADMKQEESLMPASDDGGTSSSVNDLKNVKQLDIKSTVTEDVSAYQKPHSRSSSYHSTSSGDIFYDATYITVSDISLRTQPVQLPPPSRPPPKLAHKPGHPQVKSYATLKEDMGAESLYRHMKNNEKNFGEGLSKSGSLQTTEKGASPCFYDVEVDASAAASAAMKEAIEQAQAKLKSAKESIGRKRDNFQSHKKLGQQDSISCKQKKEDGAAQGVINFSGDASQIGKENEKINALVAGEENKEKGTTKMVLDHEDMDRQAVKGEQTLQGKNMKSSQTNLEQKLGEWKVGKQYFELINSDRKCKTVQEVSQEEREENNLKANKKVNTDGLYFEPMNNDRKCQTVQEVSQEECDKKNIKANKKVNTDGQYFELINNDRKCQTVQEVSQEECDKKNVKANKKVNTDGQYFELINNDRKCQTVQEVSQEECEETQEECEENDLKANKVLNTDGQYFELINNDRKCQTVQEVSQEECEENKLKMNTHVQNFELVNNYRTCQTVQLVSQEECEEKKVKVNKKVNEDEQECKVTEMPHEFKKTRKLWGVNETREVENPAKLNADTVVSRQDEIKEILSAIRKAHVQEKTLKTQEAACDSTQEEGNKNLEEFQEIYPQEEYEAMENDDMEASTYHKKLETLNCDPRCKGAHECEEEVVKLEVCNVCCQSEGNEVELHVTCEPFENGSVQKLAEKIIVKEQTKREIEMLNRSCMYQADEKWKADKERTCFDDFNRTRGAAEEECCHEEFEIESSSNMAVELEGNTTGNMKLETCHAVENEKNLNAAHEVNEFEGNMNDFVAPEVPTEHAEKGDVERRQASIESTENERKMEAANEACWEDQNKKAKVTLQEFQHSNEEHTPENELENSEMFDEVTREKEKQKCIGVQTDSNLNKNATDIHKDPLVYQRPDDSFEVNSAADLDKNVNDANKAPVVVPMPVNENFKAVQQVGLSEKRGRVGSSVKMNSGSHLEVVDKNSSSEAQKPEVTKGTNGEVRKRERERESDKEWVKNLEEKEREREREKDRLAVERGTREAHERAAAEAWERAERIAVERVTAEARQRALAEARERAEKAAAEALEKSLSEKAFKEARLRAERAAVERATAEARERAVERAIAEKAASDARERAERLGGPFKGDSATRMRPSSDVSYNEKTQSAGAHNNNQKYSQLNNHGGGNESALRCKARLERHQRTVERAAKALAEKNMRDILAQREQAERNRLAESLDADVKRWSSGKEGNLRALLSTLQYILGPESGWQPIPLTDVLTAAAVKKAYRKATLCVHPDKLQQRGASIQQKYICEKVFDLLKEAWNRFNSEER